MKTFVHLNHLNVSYTKHFKHSICYSLMSLKCSYYFFIHALYPDVYVTSGSDTIKKLHNIISDNKKEYKK